MFPKLFSVHLMAEMEGVVRSAWLFELSRQHDLGETCSLMFKNTIVKVF